MTWTYSNISRALTFVVLLLSSVICGTACDEPVNTDNAPKSCPEGHELTGAGKCEPKSCENNKSVCGNNFQCNDASICEAFVTCTDDSPCGGGSCAKDGFCQNPEWCEFNENCIPTHICGADRKCVPNPCKPGCSPGDGVCNFETGKCENSTTCNKLNESEVCKSDSKCIDSKCVSGEEFCKPEKDSCHGRGVCNEATVQCENIQDGTCSLDTDCLEGYFCNPDNGNCEFSRCDSEKSGCTGGRGVCDPNTGLCTNKTPTCSVRNDCLSGYICVQDDSIQKNECRLISEPCGGLCQGNQECKKTSAGDLYTVECIENTTEPCRSGIDCVGSRVCKPSTTTNILECGDPNFDMCQADKLEAVNQPIEYVRYAEDGAIDNLSLCEGDEDTFVYDTTHTHVDALLVNITMDPIDVGNGEIHIDVTFNTGSESHTMTTTKDGVAQRSTDFVVGIPSSATSATVTVSAPTAKTELRYSISISGIIEDHHKLACSSARKAELNTLYNGNTINSTLSTVPKCGDDTGAVKQDIWEFTVDKESLVNIVVESTGRDGFDAVLSLRPICEASVAQLCQNTDGAEGTERIAKALPPGTYYLLVSSVGSGGEYSLRIDAKEFVCSAEDATCSTDESTSTQCAPDRFNWVDVDCGGANSCDTNSGLCEFQRGDTCGDAIVVKEDGSNIPYERTFDVKYFHNSIDVGTSCDGFNSPNKTVGRDVVFAITVPGGRAVNVTAKGESSPFDLYNDITLYALTECSRHSNQCVVGQDVNRDKNAETFVWKNNDSDETVLYVVVDHVSSRTTFKRDYQVKVTIAFQDSACNPGDFWCDGDDIKFCKDNATEEIYHTCSVDMCDSTNGTTVYCSDTKGNTCSDAIEIDSSLYNHAQPFTLSAADNNYSAPGACGSIAADRPGGRDLVFKVLDVKDKQLVKVRVRNSKDLDAMVWFTDVCTDDSLPLCKSDLGADSKKNVSVKAEEYVGYVAKENGPVYFVVETGSNDKNNAGSFELIVDVISPSPKCTHNRHEIIGCNAAGNAIEYCDKDNVLHEYACTCNAGEEGPTTACTTGEANNCFDAKLVNSGTETEGIFSANQFEAGTTNDFEVKASDDTGECLFSTNAHKWSDRVFRFRLNRGETLTLNYLPSGRTKSIPNSMRGYILKDCFDISTCKSSFWSGPQTLTYHAEEDQDVYFVSDCSVEHIDMPEFTLKWKIDNTKNCAPLSRRCENEILYTCLRDGSGEIATTCQHGCSRGLCTLNSDDLSSIDTCSSTTLDIGTGATVVWDAEKMAANEKILNKLSCGNANLDNSNTKGRDVFFRVNVPPGKIISVTSAAVDYVITGQVANIGAYLFTDCSAVESSCVAGNTGGSSASVSVSEPEDVPAQFTYYSRFGGTYYVAADTSSSSAKGEFYTSINILDPECSQSTPDACNDAGDAVRYCSNRIFKTLPCPTGCTAGRCNTETGNTCSEAIDLTNLPSPLTDESFGTANDPYLLNYSGNAYGYTISDTSPNAVDSCLFEKFTDQNEKYYSITLKKGYHLSVDVTPKAQDSGLAVYILNSCGKHSCLVSDASNYTSSVIGRHVDLVAQYDGVYYVVVDTTNSSVSNTYDLKWSVSQKNPAACVPFTSYCDIDTGEIKWCKENGTDEAMGECIEGSQCNGTTCVASRTLNTKINSCKTAPTITKSGVYPLRSVGVFENTQGEPLYCMGDTSQKLEGLDTFFRVELQPFHTLNISLRGQGGSRPVTLFYFLATDCDELDTSCKTGGKIDISNTHVVHDVLSYTAGSQSEILIFGIDLQKDSILVDPSKLVYFDISEPECDPRLYINTCPSANELMYCSESHKVATLPCTCNGGQCESNTVKGETCYDAIAITGLTETKPVSGKYQLSNFSNDYDFPREKSCTAAPIPGKDIVFNVEIPMGKKVKVTARSVSTALTGQGGTCVVSDLPDDISIYAATECNSVSTSCVNGVDNVGNITCTEYSGTDDTNPEEVLILPGDPTISKRVYVFIDSYWSQANKEVDVKFEVVN